MLYNYDPVCTARDSIMARIERMFDRYEEDHPGVFDVPRAAAALTGRIFNHEPATTHPDYSDLTRQAIVSAVVGGEGVRSIHARTGIAEGTIRRWCRCAGVDFTRRALPDDVRRRILADLSRCQTTNETPSSIALRYRVDPSTVSRLGRAAGYRFTRGVRPRLIARPS